MNTPEKTVDELIEDRLYKKLYPELLDVKKDILDLLIKLDNRQTVFEEKIEALITEEKEVDKNFNERLLKVEKGVSRNFIIIISFIIFSVIVNFIILKKDHEAERRSIYRTESILDSLIRKN